MPETPALRQLDVRTGEGSVCCYVAGSLDTPVIVGHAGTPVTGLHQTGAFLYAGVSDLCHVAIDRPGYGGSPRIEGRTVADVADIVRSVLDELGVERAAVYGHSGGGPHALATAALLPERITRAAVVAGMAPGGRPDFDYCADQTDLMQEEMRAALEGPEASREFLRALDSQHAANPWTAVLTKGDLRVIEDTGALTESVIEALNARDASTRVEDGYVDDMHAFATPWGFELESITVPVHLLQGTDDLMVAPAHAEWLRARIPGATLELLPGQGHVLQRFYGEVFDWLTA